MSVLLLLVPVAIAGIAALVWCAISDSWAWRSFVAMWAFGLLILVLPLFVHP